MKFLGLHTICILLFISACTKTEKNITVANTNPNLQLDNGVLLYNQKPYSGNIVSYYKNNNLKSDVKYKSGRKHGTEKQWYSNSNLAIERYYTKGIKTGIHRAWWDNGTQKFEYHFNTKGMYHGIHKEWYASGQIYRDFNYINGQEVGKQRLYKSNGTIKANYEVVNGERFGLIGLKKCKTVTINSTNLK